MDNIPKTEEEWKEKLDPDQYHVLRKSGTERPFTGKFNAHYEKGVYVCAGCGTALFNHQQKFDSGCGWPSFDDELEEANIVKIRDTTLGMVRVEIRCKTCNGHLGHLFDDGPTETGLRYCVNSLSLDFKKNV